MTPKYGQIQFELGKLINSKHQIKGHYLVNDSSDREDVWEVPSVARGTILSADQCQIERNHFDVGFEY